MDEKEKAKKVTSSDQELNKQLEGNDKAPGEEAGEGEKVTQESLKGKSVDADPEDEKGKPLPIKK